jgi:multidrug efflux pump subunit AcrA (membrane-fusion protein)
LFNFGNSSRGIFPVSHKDWEQLCALAAAGQLDGSEMQELNNHLAACSACRALLESLSGVSTQIGPLLADNLPIVDIDPPPGMRSRFLSRLAAEEFPTRVVELPRRPVLIAPRAPETVLAPKRISAWSAVGAVAACGFTGWIGFGIGARRADHASVQTPPTPIVAAVPAKIPSVISVVPEKSSDLPRLEQRNAALADQITQVQDQVAASKAAQAALVEQLAAAQNRLTATMAQAQSAQAETQAARTLGAALKDQVDQLRQQLAESDRRLAAQRRAADDLTAQLEATARDLDREREMKSTTSQVGELMAARNLHIVDVYDADGNGRRKDAVGRVFYIDGKSLVFYAYDLDQPGRFRTDVAFHVWGGKVGSKDVVHNLGILRKDDGGPSRWKLTFDDPRVLARINSVYVTVEAANRKQTVPNGKKILFAYLGTPPNHSGLE